MIRPRTQNHRVFFSDHGDYLEVTASATAKKPIANPSIGIPVRRASCWWAAKAASRHAARRERQYG
jgi:hypothetical protein